MICSINYTTFFSEHWFFCLFSIFCIILSIVGGVLCSIGYDRRVKNPYADVEKIEIKIITEKENPENADSQKETKLD